MPIRVTNGWLSVTSPWSGRRARGTTPLIRSIDPYAIRGLRMRCQAAILLGLRDFTNRFAVFPNQHGIPVSFDVQSGTVIDVLNRLMESADTVLWNASYRPNAQPGQRYPGWDLKMQLMDATSLRHLTESHP